MSISLTDGVTTIALPEDLYWSDELEWVPVEQAVERGVTGALMIDIGQVTGGRPITLISKDESSGWISRAALVQLRTWAATPAAALELTLRGETRDVRFRLHDAPAIQAEPIVHFDDVDPDDNYTTTLKFMEI